MSNASSSTSNTLATKVLFAKLGSQGAKLFFSVAIGVNTPDGPVYGTIIKECVLRESAAKGTDYVSFPSKPRVKKTSAQGVTPVTYELQYKDGKPVYDDLVDLYFEGQQDERKPTEAAWAFRKQVIEQAVAAYNALANGETGPGVAVPADVARTTATAGAAKPKRAGLFTEGSDDIDDLPF